jgi:hypothetical protein
MISCALDHNEEAGVTRKLSSYRRRAAVLGIGFLFACGTVATASGANAATTKRPVEVTFDNQSSQDIAACIFGSGGRCTNGGIAAGATAVVTDQFNTRRTVDITAFETGTGTPGSVTRTVAATSKLCATVTDGRGGSLQLRVRAGAC